MSQFDANSQSRREVNPEGVTLWFSRRDLHVTLKS